eukprot:5830672-Pleurochrysis_carterae.AAC.1
MASLAFLSIMWSHTLKLAACGYRIQPAPMLTYEHIRTLTNRLARVSCCHRHFYASGRIKNEFKGHANILLGAAAKVPACIWLSITLLILLVLPEP